MKSPYVRTSAHYPNHLHNTHLIPPIKQREKGVKPKEASLLKSNHHSNDGFRDKMIDGSWKTTHPVYLRKKWIEGGSKRGLY